MLPLYAYAIAGIRRDDVDCAAVPRLVIVCHSERSDNGTSTRQLFRAPNVVQQMLRKPVAELDQRDAVSYACGEQVTWYAATVREWDAAFEAAGGAVEIFEVLNSENPLVSR